MIKRAIEDSWEAIEPFDAIGVSTAGQVDSSRGCIRYANENIAGYTGMEVRKILEEEFHVPVAVENDVNAAADRGSSYLAQGNGAKDFFVLPTGRKMGRAIVIGAKCLRQEVLFLPVNLVGFWFIRRHEQWEIRSAAVTKSMLQQPH